jgi:bacillithiol disulfide reductase
VSDDRDLLIVGAGPAGLATAIAATQAGLDYEIVEKGALVNSVFHFPRQMVFFTTAELLEIGGLPFVTPYEKPTRVEALRYYRRVADTYSLRVTFDEKVLSIEAGSGGFAVRTERAVGEARTWQAGRVVLATGYYDHPNILGVPGEDLPHVAHYYDDPHPFWRKHVVVVGAKNSAAIAALELYRAGAASVTLVHRGQGISPSVKYWIKPDIENRIKEGSVKALFGTCVREITPTHVRVERADGHQELPADQVFLLTGYTPDVDLMRRAGVRVDPDTLKPEHDPRTSETNVPGLFLAGALVSGRDTGKVFIENGRFHGEAIVNAITRARD